MNNTSDNTIIKKTAEEIWRRNEAILKGAFKEHEFGLVVLPMFFIKRLHDCLLPTHDTVLKEYASKKNLAVIDNFLVKASGYKYYNTSKFTFDLLCADPDNIDMNFQNYLDGFSENVRDVLQKFKFNNAIERLKEIDSLYLIIKEYNTSNYDFGMVDFNQNQSGSLFAELVRLYFESFNQDAKVHFTTNDIIELMSDILLVDADFSTESDIPVYDMAMCTSQMLSGLEYGIHKRNSNVNVLCYGQGHDENTFTFALAKADVIIRGGDSENIRFGNTLTKDQFPGYHFRYVISNPPLGDDWKKEKKIILDNKKHCTDDRFSPGITKEDDSQLLFVLNGLYKLDNNGKMAILQNGSPLFDNQVGASDIRRYIIEENDWLEAIIQLPVSAHLFTAINTYIWVLNKNKPAYRAGKVQLIDASHCGEQRQKNISFKRYDISDSCRELIIKAYEEFKNDAIYQTNDDCYCHSKIFDNEEFGYYRITVERPLLDDKGIPVLKKGKLVADSSKSDTENVPLKEDIDEYFAREVLPYAPDAWIDKKKTKVGYEIPMTRYFYKYKAPEGIRSVLKKLSILEADIQSGLDSILREAGEEVEL